VGERKIAAIGIHVARGVTSHGFAFNVTTDLKDFALINPCGITDRAVTSLAREVADAKSLPGLEALAQRAARQFGSVFDEQILALENLDALRTQTRDPLIEKNSAASEIPAAESPAREFPAEDTPLGVPAEIERLRNAKTRPVSA
jgi:lipoyl(octanoyl) transferase